MLINISGTIADSSQFDSGGVATAEVVSGSHKGHTITLKTNKFNCGAYHEDLNCSCEAHWHNQSNGCWQQGHQRDEHGDPELSKVLREFYRQLQ